MVSISKSRVKQRQVYSRKEKSQEKLLLTLLGVLVGVYVLLRTVVGSGGASPGSASLLDQDVAAAVFDKHRPRLKLEKMASPLLSESYNAIAMDIIKLLECETLLNNTANSQSLYNNGGGGMYDDGIMQEGMGDGGEDFGGGGKEEENGNVRRRQRRLQEADMLLEQAVEAEKAVEGGGGGGDGTDDGDDSLKQNNNPDGRGMGGADGADMGMGDGMYDDLAGNAWQGYEEVTAKELFCLAASTTTLEPDKLNLAKQRVQCDAANTKQRALLDVWSSARAQMTEELLLKTLNLATESTRTLGSNTVNLWAPRNDDGINFVLSQVSNQDESARQNGNNFYGLSHNLGPDHLYVDVGSCLGITTLAVILQYPKTRVVSVEPAPPNWLMQEINMKCNLDDEQQPKVLLAGVGPHTKSTLAAKLLWRPSAVTATRAWTPAAEKIKGEDEELIVQLKPFKTILAEADVLSAHHIDVLHVDCEGCEYK